MSRQFLEDGLGQGAMSMRDDAIGLAAQPREGEQIVDELAHPPGLAGDDAQHTPALRVEASPRSPPSGCGYNRRSPAAGPAGRARRIGERLELLVDASSSAVQFQDTFFEVLVQPANLPLSSPLLRDVEHRRLVADNLSRTVAERGGQAIREEQRSVRPLRRVVARPIADGLQGSRDPDGLVLVLQERRDRLADGLVLTRNAPDAQEGGIDLGDHATDVGDAIRRDRRVKDQVLHEQRLLCRLRSVMSWAIVSRWRPPATSTISADIRTTRVSPTPAKRDLALSGALLSRHANQSVALLGMHPQAQLEGRAAHNLGVRVAREGLPGVVDVDELTGVDAGHGNRRRVGAENRGESLLALSEDLVGPLALADVGEGAHETRRLRRAVHDQCRPRMAVPERAVLRDQPALEVQRLAGLERMLERLAVPPPGRPDG